MQVIEATEEAKMDRASAEWIEHCPPICRDLARDHEDIDSFARGNSMSKTVRGTVDGFIDNPTQFMVVHGERGRGKSCFVAWLGTRLVTDSSSRYFSWPDLMSRLSLSPFDEKSRIRRSMVEADVLVFDDVGAVSAQQTDFQLQTMWAVINERYNDPSKITIITTNLALVSQDGDDGQSFESWLGPTAYSRITSSWTRIHMIGTDLRQAVRQ